MYISLLSLPIGKAAEIKGGSWECSFGEGISNAIDNIEESIKTPGKGGSHRDVCLCHCCSEKDGKNKKGKQVRDKKFERLRFRGFSSFGQTSEFLDA